MNITQLTQEIVNDIFLILRKVHDSHWKAPMVKEILDTINADGLYEFKAGTVEKRMWTCRFSIAKEMNGELTFVYHRNNDLPRMMREKQETMKEAFEKLFLSYLTEHRL